MPASEDRLPAPPPASRLLVVRLGALGDVVRTRFAFEGLRALYPDAEIDWLVEDRAAAGLDGIVGLHDAVLVPRSRLRARAPVGAARMLRARLTHLRERRYDVSVDFHGVLKSALWPFASGIPVRVGYAAPVAREGSARLLTHRARLGHNYVSRFERNAALVRYLGGAVPSAPPPLALDPAREPALPSGAWIAIHPGTSPATAYKRWEPDRYGAVARRLREARGVEALVTWGPVPGEREAALAVVEAAGGAARLAPRTGSVGDYLALLRRARLFLGSDSGPAHLAALAGLPAVVLFGPTDPVENAPFPGVPNRVIHHDVGCNPCREGCPARPCMGAIREGEVLAAALELLGDG